GAERAARQHLGGNFDAGNDVAFGAIEQLVGGAGVILDRRPHAWNDLARMEVRGDGVVAEHRRLPEGDERARTVARPDDLLILELRQRVDLDAESVVAGELVADDAHAPGCEQATRSVKPAV